MKLYAGFPQCKVSTSHEAKTEEDGAAQVVKLLKLMHGSCEATLVAPLSYSKLPEAGGILLRARPNLSRAKQSKRAKAMKLMQ